MINWTSCLSKSGAAVLAVAGLIVSAAPQHAAAETSFMLAHAMPPAHIFHPTSEKFIEELGDDFNVEYHPGGDMGDWVSLFEQSMQGALPMTMTFSATEFDPRLNIFITGYVVDDWETAEKMYGPDGPIIPIYNQILKDLDLKLLSIVPVDFVGYAMRKGTGTVPLNLPEEAQGIKMRVTNQEIAIKRFNELGFSAVPMPYSELYTALQLGTVDARAFGPPVEIWEMRDVLESYVYSRDYFEHAYWLVNQQWWDSLDAEEQEKIQGAANTATSWAWSEAKNMSDDLISQIKETGIEVHEFNDEQLEKVKSIVYAEEWPAMEKLVGKDLMDQLKSAANIE